MHKSISYGVHQYLVYLRMVIWFSLSLLSPWSVKEKKTMFPLRNNTDVATSFDQENNMPPKIDQQQFENVHSSTQNRLPFTPLAVRRPRRQQRKRKPYGRT